MSEGYGRGGTGARGWRRGCKGMERGAIPTPQALNAPTVPRMPVPVP